MIYAFGYARKSPDDKKDRETSLSNQTDLIESYCKKNNINLIDIFIDPSISGSDRKRKEFLRMIEKSLAFKKENKDELIIIVKDQNRFCRDVGFFQDTLTDLQAYNIKVFSIVKNGFLSHEDLGDVVKSVVDANDVYEKRRLSKVLFDRKKEQGLPPIKPPFGYKMQIKTINGMPRSTGRWVIDNKKADIVREIYKDYLKVNYKETIQRLKISQRTYYKIIENIKKGIYSGYVIYNKKIRDSKKNIVRIETIKYLGKHEPIIK